MRKIERENPKLRGSELPSVLVTGAAGFVGSNLCRNLLRKGHEVYAVDNFITGRKENIEEMLKQKNFHFFEMDITEDRFVQLFLADEIRIGQIFHLACPTGVPNIQPLAEEMLLTSSIGTRNVMEISRKFNAKVLFSSSCEVYGQPQKFPQDESYNGDVDPVGPRSPYEEGKRFSESLIMMYVRKYDIDADIVRFFNVYGPGMWLEDHRVVPKAMKSILSGEKPIIYGDGSQTRTFLYIDDLIRGLVLVMEKGGQGNVYNIGSTTQVPIRQLVGKMSELAGWSEGIEHRPHFIEDHLKRQPSVRKIRKLGWRKKVPLERGIIKTIEYFRREKVSTK